MLIAETHDSSYLLQLLKCSRRFPSSGCRVLARSSAMTKSNAFDSDPLDSPGPDWLSSAPGKQSIITAQFTEQTIVILKAAFDLPEREQYICLSCLLLDWPSFVLSPLRPFERKIARNLLAPAAFDIFLEADRFVP